VDTDPSQKAPWAKDYEKLFDDVVENKKKVQFLDPKNEQVEVNKRNVSAVMTCSDNLDDALAKADHKIIIVGGGPAGLSAAIYAARGEMAPLVVAKDGGQLESTSIIDNYPGFENGVDAVEMVQNLQKQAERFGAKFKTCEIIDVELLCRPFKVTCAGGDVMTSSSLIIATGAGAKWLDVPGEQEFLSKGVHTCATCDGYFYKGKNTAVIGGGDTAMEQALFLARLVDKVTVVHRRSSFRASKAMVSRVMKAKNIEILWDTVVTSFLSNDGKKLAGLALEDRETKTETVLDVEGAFVAIGHVPNTHLFQGKGVRVNEDGYIHTIPGSTRTSIEGVYAAGDVADEIYRQAITSAGTGAMAAIDAERWLCEHGC